MLTLFLIGTVVWFFYAFLRFGQELVQGGNKPQGREQPGKGFNGGAVPGETGDA